MRKKNFQENFNEHEEQDEDLQEGKNNKGKKDNKVNAQKQE